MTNFNQTAAEVVEKEIAGLSAVTALLRDDTSALSKSVNDAVARLTALEGRLILTGMGKSGHVARKIAATFASTGTAATLSIRPKPAMAISA